jgi:CHAD domain-containing protein
VTTRRLDAALRLWRPFLGGGRGRARRRLRALRRTLGPVRELEVDVESVREARARLEAEPRVAAEHLLVSLERRLVRARARAARAAAATRVARVRRAVERSLRGVERRVALEPRPLDRLSTAVFTAREGARAALALALESGDDARLHEARIAVKRLRYAVETMEPDQGVPLARRARDLQHALGDVHDAAVLRDRITRRARRLRRHGAEAGAAALMPLLEIVEASRRDALAGVREMSASLEPRTLPLVPRAGVGPA